MLHHMAETWLAIAIYDSVTFVDHSGWPAVVSHGMFAQLHILLIYPSFLGAAVSGHLMVKVQFSYSLCRMAARAFSKGVLFVTGLTQSLVISCQKMRAIVSSDKSGNLSVMAMQFEYHVRQQAITWTNVDPDICRHMASLGRNELMLVKAVARNGTKSC